MNIVKKAVLGVAVASAVIGAKGNVGITHDLNGTKVYGTATPVSFTEKYVCAYAGEMMATISVTDKWYTDDPCEKWTVWTFEICKGEDDAWFVMEFGM